MKKVDNKEIIRRVGDYLIKVNTSDIKRHDLKRRGRYRITSGHLHGHGHRDILDIVEGRYIDALAYAVQLDEFVGEWSPWVSGHMLKDEDRGMVEAVRSNPLDKKTGDSILKILRENN